MNQYSYRFKIIDLRDHGSEPLDLLLLPPLAEDRPTTSSQAFAIARLALASFGIPAQRDEHCLEADETAEDYLEDEMLHPLIPDFEFEGWRVYWINRDRAEDDVSLHYHFTPLAA